MPNPSTSNLPIPKSWDEFEDIVWEIYIRKWQNPYAQRYGKTGQVQHGIDIYSQPTNSSSYIAIQCKRYENSKLNIKTIREEVSKAECFSSPISEYIIATTVSRDKNIQDDVRQLNDKRKSENKFFVHILFWEDVCKDLAYPNNRDLLKKYYSEWGEIFQNYEKSQENILTYISLKSPQLPRTLKKFSTILGWSQELTDDEIACSIQELKHLIDILEKLPLQTRQLLTVIVEKSHPDKSNRLSLEVLISEIMNYCQISIQKILEHLIILRKYNIISCLRDSWDAFEIDEIDPLCDSISLLRFSLKDVGDGWTFWVELKQFAEKTEISIYEVVVNLNFSVLDF